MSDKESTFFDLAMESKSLLLGDFTLKSGKKSPYFFNVGAFFEQGYIDKLADLYSELILESSISFDVIFGPAYKGIPIATTTAVALADSHKLDVPYCFNRKEAKTHGEGGNLVGSPLEGKVMLVDDVITAGTAIRESMTLIEQQQASLSGVLIALDRQERGNGELSAIQEVERDFGTQVISIVSLADVVAYLSEKGGFDSEISAINTYRENYGI